MKRRMMTILLAAALGVAGITGCGNTTALDTGKNAENQPNNSQPGKTNGGTGETAGETDKTNKGADTGEDGSVMDMLSEADAVATVVDFSESGCTVIKGTQSEDEQKIAAAGETPDDGSKLSVIYSDSVSFQLATAAAGDTDGNLQDTEKSEVKKQSNVYLYGTYQDDGTFLADKVVIYRTLR